MLPLRVILSVVQPLAKLFELRELFEAFHVSNSLHDPSTLDSAGAPQRTSLAVGLHDANSDHPGPPIRATLSRHAFPFFTARFGHHDTHRQSASTSSPSPPTPRVLKGPGLGHFQTTFQPKYFAKSWKSFFFQRFFFPGLLGVHIRIVSPNGW